MANVLMIIAPKNFRDEELLYTKEELEYGDVDVKIASKTMNTVTGMLGAKIKPDILLDDINVDDYDATIFVGGTGASMYFDDPKAHEIAKATIKKRKILAAICIAPSILANAGLLEGRNATSFPSERSNLESKGAIYTGEAVTIDGDIITAKGPEAARKFGKAILKALQ